ncbi:Replication initiation factor [Bacillus velezensis AS43.3]|nr:Replication initiation factor [Bacillus velezensis AS43.3]MCP1565400.1 phage replication initiation protein [Bacillus velezensis]QIR31822.1 hypothetical protein BVELS4_00536 [Bacillus velezensis]
MAHHFLTIIHSNLVLEADEHLGKTDLSDMIAEAELADKHKKMLDVYMADVADMVV